MDIKSYLKSSSLSELLSIKGFLLEEIESRQAAPKKLRGLRTYTDGASRGNPGHAGIGILLFDENDEKVLQDYRYIGTCANNEAEYRALLLALDRAAEVTKGRLDCYLDSELLVRQLNGQ